MRDKTYFVATPSYGKFYFLHKRNKRTRKLIPENYVCSRGAKQESVAMLSIEEAHQLIAAFKAKGIKGAEGFYPMHRDEVFGFIKDQVSHYEKPKWHQYEERIATQRGSDGTPR